MAIYRHRAELDRAKGVAAVFLVSLQSANAQKPAGNITDLGTPEDFSAAFGINNISSDPASIQVVGRSLTAAVARGYPWKPTA
jgi:hypothetical protein